MERSSNLSKVSQLVHEVELGFEPKEFGINTQSFHTILPVRACGQNGMQNVTGGRFLVITQ